MLTERREREIGRYIDKIWNREKTREKDIVLLNINTRTRSVQPNVSIELHHIFFRYSFM